MPRAQRDASPQGDSNVPRVEREYPTDERCGKAVRTNPVFSGRVRFFSMVRLTVFGKSSRKRQSTRTSECPLDPGNHRCSHGGANDGSGSSTEVRHRAWQPITATRPHTQAGRQKVHFIRERAFVQGTCPSQHRSTRPFAVEDVGRPICPLTRARFEIGSRDLISHSSRQAQTGKNELHRRHARACE